MAIYGLTHKLTEAKRTYRVKFIGSPVIEEIEARSETLAKYAFAAKHGITGISTIVIVRK